MGVTAEQGVRRTAALMNALAVAVEGRKPLADSPVLLPGRADILASLVTPVRVVSGETAMFKTVPTTAVVVVEGVEVIMVVEEAQGTATTAAATWGPERV